MSLHLPKLIKLYIRNVVIGFALAAIFVGLLLWYDTAGLWSLASNTKGGGIAIAMLLIFNGLVFAGVQFAITIMLMGDDDTPKKGRKIRPAPQLLPAHATAQKVTGDHHNRAGAQVPEDLYIQVGAR